MQVGLEVVVLCCAIKPLCAWNAEDCATTSRERCGGQGYLSVNRFGELIGFAHAGMTAEGDNRSVAMVRWGFEVPYRVNSRTETHHLHV